MSGAARCRSCGREIAWALTPTNANLPLDHPPSHDGNVAAHRDNDGALKARVLKHGEQKAPWEVLATSHWETCPRAEEHRTRTRKGDR